MKEGVLYLVQSKNPPVFKTPMRITYTNDPELEQAFLFSSPEYSSCNLSKIQQLTTTDDGVFYIRTLNSMYILATKD